jgi:hemerythrin-like domain-containing protein
MHRLIAMDTRRNGMKITDAFLGEHGVFYAQFDLLEQSLKEGEPLDQIKSKTAMLAVGLISHAHLENELLFNALDKTPAGSGPVPIMRREHEVIDHALSGVQQMDDAVQVHKLIKSTLELARQHFSKEEKILFPLANQMLPEESLIQFGNLWGKRRSVTLHGNHV